MTEQAASGGSMVGRYIPPVLALMTVMAAYKLAGVGDWINEFSQKELQDKYDYIIVGAGTSGAVLASRLSENASINILLLEAGGHPRDNPDIDIPINADHVRGEDSPFDWYYPTSPQKYSCKGHVDNINYINSGKGLGGSTLINYMQYVRGSRHDYDDWANNGATGWSYKELLPYFIKSEDNQNGDYVRTLFHGYGGQMAVQDINISPINRILEAAFKEHALKKRDVNGRNHFGFSPTQATIRSGIRWSTYRSFLRRAMDRPNLHILTDALAQKVVFEGRKASGVIFRHENSQKIVKVNNDVILTAGTVGTTKLLLLSGIGPKKHLQTVQVPVVADIPVGENLQDHVMADPVEYFTPYQVSVTAAKAENFVASWAYTLFGTGMKMSPRFRESVLFFKTRQQPPHIKYPLLALNMLSNVGYMSAKSLNIKEEVWEALHGTQPHRDGFSVFPILLHPRSKGFIRLRSNNPDDLPIVNPNYLAEDVDIKILAEGVQYARHLGSAQVLKDWKFELPNRLLPECEKYGNYSVQYIECLLKRVTIPGNSLVGTCRIGASGDPMAVVDPSLRVRGVKGLRVADASIIPSAMSADTYATEVMIGEKAADIIGEKDTVYAIKEYFKHLVAVKHKKIMEDDEPTPSGGVNAGVNAQTQTA